MCNIAFVAGKQPATGLGGPMHAAMSRYSVLQSGFFASGASFMGGLDGEPQGSPVHARSANPFSPAHPCLAAGRRFSSEPEHASMTTITTSATAAALRKTSLHSAAPQHDALSVGDRVESLHARRPGRIVRTYPDGSASVCWDDGEPQETGLGHERMPRALLILVDHEQAAVLGQKTGIDSQGFPNDRAILDPLGYVEAAKALCDASDVNLMGLACEVDVAFSRLGVLLRSINEAMSSPQFKEDDVQILVDMALEKLPDHDALFEQMEQLDRDLKWDFHERLEERRCLEAVIDAMTLAATPETPIVDIEKAAGAVYDQALGNPIYAPRWRALRIFLEQRGLVVKEEPIIEGGRPYAFVQTPDQVEAERKEIRRATKATRAAAKVPA